MVDRVREEASLAAEACVCPGGVEPAEVLEGDGDRRLLVGPLGHVTLDSDGAVVATELLGQRFEPADRAGGKHEPPAFGGKEARARGTDARRGAGDQDDAVFVTHEADTSDVTQLVVGSGSAPQLTATTGPGCSSTWTVTSAAGVEKITRSPS